MNMRDAQTASFYTSMANSYFIFVLYIVTRKVLDREVNKRVHWSYSRQQHRALLFRQYLKRQQGSMDSIL